jgi:tyrosine-protein kinase Etk/Wzc
MSLQQPIDDLIPTANADVPEHGIDLFALAVALLAEWRLMLATSLVFFALFFAIIYSLKPMYVADASFVPQAASRNNTGDLASLFSNHGPGALYIGLLQSRSVQDAVIQRADLMSLFHVTSRETARGILAGKSAFSEGADTIVKVEVRDGNAQNAAKIANAYLDALQGQNEAMGLQQSTQISQFFDRQLQKERDQLAQAETQLARTQKQTGIVSPETQTQFGLSAIAGVRTQITTLQVQLAAMLQSETDGNPQVQRVRSQIAQLQAQEQVLEGSSQSPVGAAPAAANIPQANLDLERDQREVKFHDALVETLASQFETARMNETFGHSAFQVVDLAVVPEHKAWPPRRPYIEIAMVFAAFFGFVIVVLKLFVRRILTDPRHREQMATLRKTFGSN